MKKSLIVTLAMFVLGSFGVVFGQVDHDVTVDIPEVVTIRFTDGSSRSPVDTNLDLEFEITGDAADFAGTYAPSNLASRDWADVQVFQNRNTSWDVTVSVTGDTGFDWSKIAVTPSGTDAIASSFNLTASDLEIAAWNDPNASARGWNSLGFGPTDFELTLDGTETAGEYSATVVYTLTAP